MQRVGRYATMLAIVGLVLLIGKLDAVAAGNDAIHGNRTTTGSHNGHHHHHHHHHRHQFVQPVHSHRATGHPVGQPARQPDNFVGPVVVVHQPSLSVAHPPVRHHHGGGRYFIPIPPVAATASHRSMMTTADIPASPPFEPTDSSNHLNTWMVNKPEARVNLNSANLTEVCSQLGSNTEKQLLTYISGFEAITRTMQELDEVVHLELKQKSCLSQVTADIAVSPQPFNGTSENLSYLDQDITSVTSNVINAENAATSSVIDVTSTERTIVLNESTETSVSEVAPSSSIVELVDGSTTSEPFYDAPVNNQTQSGPVRARRDGSPSAGFFGMPSMVASSSDQIGQDLDKALNDLKALRRDLSSTAEWLKQTNHTVHSALMRALLTYVTSIERRIDSQRREYAAQNRSAFLKAKIISIKEKMAALLEKLRAMIPTRIVAVNRDDPPTFNTSGSMTTGVPLVTQSTTMEPSVVSNFKNNKNDLIASTPTTTSS